MGKTKIFQMFKINDNDTENIISSAKDFSFAKGIAMRCPDLSNDARSFLPFCLLPSPFPREWFQLAKNIQSDMNYILHQVAHDRDFLSDCLSSTVKVDNFTYEIWRIYEAVLKEGNSQPLSLGLFRCDYLLDADSDDEATGIKQVENNTIASGFAGVSPKIRDLHSFILDRIGVPYSESELPENNATINFARGILAAWETYDKNQAVILFIVEDYTYNICDQRALEYTVFELRKDVRVLRCKFHELRSLATLRNQCLFVGDNEVAVVYFRHGYIPKHYIAKDWEIRLLVERSLAIKCPSAAYHLAGTKRVQLKLAAPGVLEKYISDEVTVSAIRQVFVNQLSLEMNSEGDRAVSLGIDNPHSYVMKPEREGGGNNIYGEKIKEVLKNIGLTDARQAYILMEKINPPSVSNYVIRRDVTPVASEVVGELGIYGVIMGSKEKVMMNYEAGHLLRSKEIGLYEGGISSGYGALDSPYLI